MRENVCFDMERSWRHRFFLLRLYANVKPVFGNTWQDFQLWASSAPSWSHHHQRRRSTRPKTRPESRCLNLDSHQASDLHSHPLGSGSWRFPRIDVGKDGHGNTFSFQMSFSWHWDSLPSVAKSGRHHWSARTGLLALWKMRLFRTWNSEIRWTNGWRHFSRQINQRTDLEKSLVNHGRIYAPSTCWRFQSPTVIDMP